MRTVTLIRHAVTEWNESGRFQGHTDLALSDLGRRQCRALARRFARESEPSVVHASPLRRALDSARLTLPNVEPHVDERLKEISFGVFEGHTLEENREHPEWPNWYDDPFTRRAPGGESYELVRARAVAWLADLPDVPHVVAFTHSGVIQMLVAYVLGTEHPRWRKRIALRHTGITRLLMNGDEIIIERVNDTRHLPDGNDDLLPFL